MQGILKKVDAIPPPNRGLRFETAIEAQDSEAYRVLGYSLAVAVAGVDIGSRFRPYTTPLESRNPLKVTEDFRLPPYLLQSIETARAGGDVPVTIQFTILGVSLPGGTLSGANFHAFGIGGQDPPFVIPQSRWARLSEGMGAASSAILEIPLQTGPVPGSLQPIVQRLEEARNLLSEGKTDEVVTKCRMAMEALNAIVSVTRGAAPGPPFERLEPGIATKADRGSTGQSGRAPKSDRVEAVRAAIFTMLHIGPHDGYQVFPEDARAVFWLTAGLVRYYADLIARP